MLAKIAQVSGAYLGHDTTDTMTEYRLRFPYRLRIAITTDVEHTELDYLRRFGKGETLYFSLVDYAHGRQLAQEIFYVFNGIQPDMSAYDGSRFNPVEKLYLFVHIALSKPHQIA